MSANNEYPLLDRFAPSWADVNLKIQAIGVAPLTARDFKSISSGSTVEVGMQKAGGRPKATTYGDLSHEAAMTMYMTGAQIFDRMLKDAAIAAGYVRDGDVAQISLVLFQINYTFTPVGSTEVIERRLKGCRVLGHTEAPSEGTDAATVDYKIHVTERVVVIDGVEVSLL